MGGGKLRTTDSSLVDSSVNRLVEFGSHILFCFSGLADCCTGRVVFHLYL